MKTACTILLLVCINFYAISQDTLHFEEFGVPQDSFINRAENGVFIDDDLLFNNIYNEEWGVWSGWAMSTVKDQETRGFMNQYSAKTLDSADSNTFGVVYSSSEAKIASSNNTGFIIYKIDITNSTYAYWSMKEGDSFSKKFGGESGNDPDYFKLTIKGNRGQDTVILKEFYLADFRSENNNQDYIIDDWITVDMDTIITIDSMFFELSSTDSNEIFGMNTPDYFCVDNIIYSVSDEVVATNNTRNHFGLHIFPNPANGFFNLQSEAPISHIVIRDLNGKSWNFSNNTQIDIHQLPAGFYTVKAINAKGQFDVSKLIVH